jgi:hypothetical protein
MIIFISIKIYIKEVILVFFFLIFLPEDEDEFRKFLRGDNLEEKILG